jgi:hypothetical protein
MIAENNLDYYAVSNIQQMEQGVSDDRDGEIFVFIDRNAGNPSHPYLMHIEKNTESETITSPILQVYPKKIRAILLFYVRLSLMQNPTASAITQNYNGLFSGHMGPTDFRKARRLISLLLLNVSCRQADDYPESYMVTFYNGYFETLEYIEINNRKIENIAVGEDGIIENISSGSYRIIVVTYSQLKIEAPVILTGSKKDVRIIINDIGKILLGNASVPAFPGASRTRDACG